MPPRKSGIAVASFSHPLDVFSSTMVATITTEVRALLSVVESHLEILTDQFWDYKEWTWELVDQVISKLENLRLSGVTVGDGIVGKLGVVDGSINAASVEATKQGLANTQTLGNKADTINAVLDTALEQLKRLRRSSELILGQDVEESD